MNASTRRETLDRSVIPAPRPVPPRLTARALPAYRYVPGLRPHPFRHAEGHLWCGGGPPEVAPYEPAARWQDDEPWLWGVELMAHHYWWEAHEALEGLWHQARAHADLHRGIQGVILASAALLKHHLGHGQAARRLSSRATVRLAGLAPHPTGAWRGVRTAVLSEAVHDCVHGAPWPRWSDWLVLPGGLDVP